MTRRIENKDLFYTIFGALILAGLIILTIIIEKTIAFENIVSCYTFYTYYAIIIYTVIFALTYLRSRRLTLFHAFLLLTFAFYFGGQFLVAFGYYEKLTERIFSVVDDRIPLNFKIQAMSFTLICLLFISIGFIFVIKKKAQNTKKTSKTNERLLESLYITGIVMLVVTIIPTILSLARSVYLSLTLGHLEYRGEKVEETGVWFIFSYISGWFRPSCYMILISKKNSPKRFIGYAGLAIYSILYLMTGSRYQIIEIAFCALSIIIIWKSKRITIKTLLLTLLSVFALSVILKAVGIARADSTGINMFSSEAIKDVFEENLVYQMFYTTSTTFTTISNAIYQCPKEVAFNNGAGYLGSLFYMLPSFLRPSWMSELNIDVEKVFSPLYYNWTTSGYGSSFLAEMYYNLGYYSFLACVPFGMFLAYINNKIQIAKTKGAPLMFFSYLYVYSELIWGIRSDLFLIPRHILLYVALPAILYTLIKNYKIKSRQMSLNNASKQVNEY